MRYKTLNTTEAERIMNSWGEAGATCDAGCDEEYQTIRQNIITAIESIKNRDGIKNLSEQAYKIDLALGLKLYNDILCPERAFYVREAANDGVWRYLSINVVPDIIQQRWGINPSRFWKETRRIWLKTIWWYIHLSWQGTVEETERVLGHNTTDEIVQLVERSGINGYRINLCREIMREYNNATAVERRNGLFRKIMKLNTARLKVIEPGLVRGGEIQYVKELFTYFRK